MSLITGGQTGGAVDGQVGRLGQSHQGDVVTNIVGLVVLRMSDDQINIEILRDQRLVSSVQLVLAQSDFQ